MFEGLAEKLQATLGKLRSRGRLSEQDVETALREVRLALLEADVNYKVVRSFTSRVKERAVGEEVMKSLTPAQQVVKLSMTSSGSCWVERRRACSCPGIQRC